MRKDIRLDNAIKVLSKHYGFEKGATKEHIKLFNPETKKTISLPNHRTLNSHTLANVLTQNGINKREFEARL